VTVEWELLSQIGREVKLSEVFREDQPRFDPDDLMPLRIAIGVDLAGNGNVDWQSVLIEKAVTRLQARRIEVKTVLIQPTCAPIDHPVICNAILQSDMMPRETI
jgi:hypothetical protein